jgi:hypothetical protein
VGWSAGNHELNEKSYEQNTEITFSLHTQTAAEGEIFIALPPICPFL